MPRAEPFSVWRPRPQRRWAGAGDTLQHDRGLANENLQHFAFEAAVAKRHALQMVMVDDEPDSGGSGAGAALRWIKS